MPSIPDQNQHAPDSTQVTSSPPIRDVAIGLAMVVVLGIGGGAAGAYVGNVVGEGTSVKIGAMLGGPVLIICGALVAPTQIRKVALGMLPLIVCSILGAVIGQAIGGRWENNGAFIGAVIGFLGATSAIRLKKTK